MAISGTQHLQHFLAKMTGTADPNVRMGALKAENLDLKNVYIGRDNKVHVSNNGFYRWIAEKGGRATGAEAFKQAMGAALKPALGKAGMEHAGGRVLDNLLGRIGSHQSQHSSWEVRNRFHEVVGLGEGPGEKPTKGLKDLLNEALAEETPKQQREDAHNSAVAAGKQDAESFIKSCAGDPNPLDKLKARLNIYENQRANAKNAGEDPWYEYKENKTQAEKMRSLDPKLEMARLDASISVMKAHVTRAENTEKLLEANEQARLNEPAVVKNTIKAATGSNFDLNAVVTTLSDGVKDLNLLRYLKVTDDNRIGERSDMELIDGLKTQMKKELAGLDLNELKRLNGNLADSALSYGLSCFQSHTEDLLSRLEVKFSGEQLPSYDRSSNENMARYCTDQKLNQMSKIAQALEGAAAELLEARGESPKPMIVQSKHPYIPGFSEKLDQLYMEGFPDPAAVKALREDPKYKPQVESHAKVNDAWEKNFAQIKDFMIARGGDAVQAMKDIQDNKSDADLLALMRHEDVEPSESHFGLMPDLRGEIDVKDVRVVKNN